MTPIPEVFPIKECPGYGISRDGRVWSKRTPFRREESLVWKEIRVNKTTKGYLFVGLMVNDKQRTRLVHRLMASTFIGEIPEKMEINHIDGHKDNNAVGNLEIVSSSENSIHSLNTWLQVPIRGSKHYSSHLKDEDVIEIRRLRGIGLTLTSIAEKFEISPANVSHIVRGDTWKHI